MRWRHASSAGPPLPTKRGRDKNSPRLGLADDAGRATGGPMSEDVKGDEAEAQEWLDALDSVEAFEGLERVDALLESVVTSARRKGAKLPFAANTAYVNTIHPDEQPASSRRSQARKRRSVAISAGTRRRSCCERTRNPPSSAAISRVSSRPRRCTIPVSCISGAPPTNRTAATSSTSRATALRASTPALFSRAD